MFILELRSGNPVAVTKEMDVILESGLKLQATIGPSTGKDEHGYQTVVSYCIEKLTAILGS